MIKKLTSILLCVMLLVSVLPNVALAADTVTILTERKTDDSSVSKPLPGKMSKITYKIQLNGESAEASQFDWSVSPENQGVSVDENGNVKISGDTLLESFNLSATSKTDPTVTATRAISVEAPLYYDFDNTNTETPKNTATDTDDNVYMAADSTYSEKYTDLSFGKNLAMTGGQSTVKFKFRVPIGNASATTNYAYQYFMAESGWGTYVYIVDPDAEKKTFSLQLRPHGGTNQKFVTGVTYDEWHEMKIEYNFDTMKYQFYVDGTASQLTSIPTATQTKSTLKFKYDIDDVIAYSGFDYTPELNISENSKSLLVPTVNNRTTSVKFEATSDDTSTPITWSLAENYTGVTINSQTGLVTVGNTASSGDITVKASQGTQEKTATLTLSKIYEDFESFNCGDAATSPWSPSYGTITSDGNSKYISISNSDSIRYFLPNVNSGENLVFEADFGNGNTGRVTLYANNAGDWKDIAIPTEFDVYSQTKWQKLKIVLDYKNSSYSIFINETPIKLNVKLADIAQRKTLAFSRAKLDNVTIYNVSNTAPEALDLELPDVVAGNNAVLSYKYFDESGISENCTDIKWYISDSKDSGYTLIEDANGKEFATSNEMIGKYLKVVVTPAHIDEFDPSVTKTGAAKEAICRVLDMSAEVTSVTVGGEAADFGKTNVSADETNVEAIFNLKTAPNTEKTFVLALAYYTDDVLTKLDYQEVTLDENTQTSSKTLNLTSGAGIYKIFAWDENANTPLIKVISFK